MLLLAALLAIAVYGVWYFMANTEGDPMERVAALPDRFASLLDEEPDCGRRRPAARRAPAREEPPPTPQSSARAGDTSSGIEAEATVVAIREPSAPELELEPDLEPELRAAPPDGGTASRGTGSAADLSGRARRIRQPGRTGAGTGGVRDPGGDGDGLPALAPPLQLDAEAHGGPGPAGAEAAALPRPRTARADR